MCSSTTTPLAVGQRVRALEGGLTSDVLGLEGEVVRVRQEVYGTYVDVQFDGKDEVSWAFYPHELEAVA